MANVLRRFTSCSNDGRTDGGDDLSCESTADKVSSGYFMANKNDQWSQNSPGKYYVDKTCIACDACVLTAPDNFKMNEMDGHAFLSKQPASPEEEALCKEAMEGCPVESIGNDG